MKVPPYVIAVFAKVYSSTMTAIKTHFKTSSGSQSAAPDQRYRNGLWLSFIYPVNYLHRIECYLVADAAPSLPWNQFEWHYLIEEAFIMPEIIIYIKQWIDIQDGRK